MARIEATLDKLVLKQGSTTLTLDKDVRQRHAAAKAAAAVEQKAGSVCAFRYR